MAQVSNPATLSSVKSVFGGNLTLYGYRRGAGIPNLGAYSAVSTTTPSLASMAGLIYPPVSLVAVTIFDTGVGGENGTGYLDVGVDGRQKMGDGIPSVLKSNTAWLLIGSSGDYDVMLQKVSGDNPTGDVLDTWLNLGASSGNWIWTISVNGTKTFSGFLKLRPAGGGSDLASVSVSVSVSKEP